jgi:hypothetical protein
MNQINACTYALFYGGTTARPLLTINKAIIGEKERSLLQEYFQNLQILRKTLVHTINMLHLLYELLRNNPCIKIYYHEGIVREERIIGNVKKLLVENIGNVMQVFQRPVDNLLLPLNVEEDEYDDGKSRYEHSLIVGGAGESVYANVLQVKGVKPMDQTTHVMNAESMNILQRVVVDEFNMTFAPVCNWLGKPDMNRFYVWLNKNSREGTNRALNGIINNSFDMQNNVFDAKVNHNVSQMSHLELRAALFDRLQEFSTHFSCMEMRVNRCSPPTSNHGASNC